MSDEIEVHLNTRDCEPMQPETAAALARVFKEVHKQMSTACCWTDKADFMERKYGSDSPQHLDAMAANSTCMLTAGHEGAHEWTLDSKIELAFSAREMNEMENLRDTVDKLRYAACDPNSPIYGSDMVPWIDDVTTAWLQEHPEDDDTPLTAEYLRSLGFIDHGSFGLSLEFKKAYGDDTATFRLVASDWPNLAEGCCWEIYCKSIECEEEGTMLPCEPTTRGQLRKLCSLLGIKLN